MDGVTMEPTATGLALSASKWKLDITPHGGESIRHLHLSCVKILLMFLFVPMVDGPERAVSGDEMISEDLTASNLRLWTSRWSLDARIEAGQQVDQTILSAMKNVLQHLMEPRPEDATALANLAITDGPTVAEGHRVSLGRSA